MIGARGFQFSFTWIFAILVGGSVLFLAIFAATRVIDTGYSQTNTEVAAQLEAILSPLETNLEASKLYTISLPQETRIINTCKAFGTFGEQQISTSVIGLGGKWSNPGLPVSFFNKYIFSSRTVEGKKIFAFVEPYYMPYKVADPMILYTDKYCFVSSPSKVREDIELAALPNVNFSESRGLCDRDSITVCFDGEDCDVEVNPLAETVTKGAITVDYKDNLMYAAIFSDTSLYECQLERIKKRASEIARLYVDKAALVDGDGCTSGLALDLQGYSEQLSSGASLSQISFISEDIRSKNDRITCPLF